MNDILMMIFGVGFIIGLVHAFWQSFEDEDNGVEQVAICKTCHNEVTKQDFKNQTCSHCGSRLHKYSITWRNV